MCQLQLTIGSAVGQEDPLWITLLPNPCRSKSVPVLPTPPSPIKQEGYLEA